jgi:CheY-like chemotaxis protein
MGGGARFDAILYDVLAPTGMLPAAMATMVDASLGSDLERALGVVMVVDDSEDAQEIYESCLVERGYRVIAALSATSALRLLKDGTHADLVVVDLLMPQMDGMEFLFEMRRDPRFDNLPVIVASGVAVPPAVRLPGVHYLTKPLQPAELLRSIRASIKKR